MFLMALSLLLCGAWMELFGVAEDNFGSSLEGNHERSGLVEEGLSSSAWSLWGSRCFGSPAWVGFSELQGVCDEEGRALGLGVSLSCYGPPFCRKGLRGPAGTGLWACQEAWFLAKLGSDEPGGREGQDSSGSFSSSPWRRWVVDSGAAAGWRVSRCGR